MLTHDVISAKGGVLWMGAYECGEPVASVSENEALMLDVPGAFFADLLTATHLTSDYLTLSRYEITGGRLMPHGRVAAAVRIVGAPIEFMEFTTDQVISRSEDALEILVPNLAGDDRFLALVDDRFVTLRCISREPVAAPSWAWTPEDCQWWSARFAVRGALGVLS